MGAKNMLEKALSSVDRSRVCHFLLECNCDWIEFQLNIPSASHMGGVWERQITTARNVLSVLLDQCGSQLNDESLQTFMMEVEAVVNSRPLTVENLTSPDALEPITPNHLLTGKSRVVLPPPGEFQRADISSKEMEARPTSGQRVLGPLERRVPSYPSIATEVGVSAT